MTELKCPVCFSTDFVEHRGVPNIKCAQCGLTERGRGTWLILEDYCRIGPGSRVAHFAPESPIGRRLFPICGAGYERYDNIVAKYPDPTLPPMRKADLCALSGFEAGVYDAVIHNHVIEHLQCNYTMVLLNLHALLKPGGVHIFSFPMSKGHYREDLAPDLTRDHRKRHFAQGDHARLFGLADLDRTVGMVFGPLAAFALDRLIEPARLDAANMRRRSGHMSAVFGVRA